MQSVPVPGLIHSGKRSPSARRSSTWALPDKPRNE
jgi:hypothetical protein